MIKNLLSNIIDTEVQIMVFTIGNICKEIQRIQFDLEKGDTDSAVDRCENLDSLLCDIEDGSVELEHYHINNNDSINSRNVPSQEYIDFLQAEIPEQLTKRGDKMKDCTSCLHGCGGGSDVYCSLGLTSVYMTETKCPYFSQQHHGKPAIYEIWEIKKLDKHGLKTEENRLGVYKEYKTAQEKYKKLINVKYVLVEKELDG